MARKVETMEQKMYRSARQEWAEDFPILMLSAYGYQGTKASAGLPHVDGWVHRLDGEARIVKSARIQAKYTFTGERTGIQIESPHFDFLVIVQDIVEGYGVCLRDRMRYWVIPKEHFLKIWKNNRVLIGDIDPCYQDANSIANIWQPIIDFLEER